VTVRVWVSITIYDELYKVTSHVSLVTALIMSFICHLSWTSTSVEMCLNLWTFNKDFCISRARSVLWLAVRRWCHTFMCTRSVNSGSSLSWQRKLMISFIVPIKTDCIGLVLSTLNLSYNSECVHLQSWYRPPASADVHEFRLKAANISNKILQILLVIIFICPITAPENGGLCIQTVVIPKHFMFCSAHLKSALQLNPVCFNLIIFQWHTETKLWKLCQCPNIYIDGPDCICVFLTMFLYNIHSYNPTEMYLFSQSLCFVKINKKILHPKSAWSGTLCFTCFLNRS